MRARSSSGRLRQALLACTVAAAVVSAGAWLAMMISGPLATGAKRQKTTHSPTDVSPVGRDGHSSSRPVTAINQANPTANTTPQHENTVVDDDGRMLWAAPTCGPELPLDYVPDGVQLLFSSRPAEILASPEGARVIKALGPRFEAARKSWERRTQLRLDDIEELLVTFVARNEMKPGIVYIVRMAKSNTDVGHLRDANGVVERDGGWSFYTSPDEHGRIRVIGDREHVLQVKNTAGSPPTLRRELAKLHRTTDRRRHVIVLLAPNFLSGDGRKMFTGSLRRLVEPLEHFLGDGVQAGMISFHFGDILYGELRLSGTLDTPAHRLAVRIGDRVRLLPGQVEEHLLGVQLDPYWRKLALRYAKMVQTLADHTRVAYDSEHAMANFVLPGAAAHNLMLASELALVSPPVTMQVHSNESGAPRTFRDVLEYRMTIDIPQQSLDGAVNDLLIELREALPNLSDALDIKIVGSALREEGITKNQQIKGFRMQESSVAQILTGMVIKANPVPNVPNPADPRQKLLWLLGPDPSGASNEIIFITTRSAAIRNQMVLPDVFVP